MKVLIDTNILISAALNPDGTPSAAFIKAVCYPNQGIICEQTVDELRRVFNRKFPDRAQALERFLSQALAVLAVVPMPEEAEEDERRIRDSMDRPIFRAAIHAGADVLLTGDKDFLESGISHPAILTAAEFLSGKSVH